MIDKNIKNIFNKVKNTLENDVDLQSKIDLEQEVVYYMVVLDWFYVANKMALNNKQLEIIPENPLGRRTQIIKKRLQKDREDLLLILTDKHNEIIRMKGSGVRPIDEFNKIFINPQ